LAEFTYLKKYIDWFKKRQEQKLVSLNTNLRRRQKDSDNAFRSAIKAERELLAKSDFGFKEVRLGPPLPPKIKAVKKSDSNDDDDVDVESGDEDNESYGKVDIPLRETLRVVLDAIALGKDPKFLASDHAPLTAIASKNG